MPTDIVLRVPARAGSIHLLRTVASSVGTWSDLSVDDLDDVRLAVTEAASYLVDDRGPAATLSLRLSPVDGGIRARVTLDRTTAGSPDRGRDERMGRVLPGSLAWQILQALSEDLRPVDEADEVGLEFTKRAGSGM